MWLCHVSPGICACRSQIIIDLYYGPFYVQCAIHREFWNKLYICMCQTHNHATNHRHVVLVVIHNRHEQNRNIYATKSWSSWLNTYKIETKYLHDMTWHVSINCNSSSILAKSSEPSMKKIRVVGMPVCLHQIPDEMPMCKMATCYFEQSSTPRIFLSF